MNTPFLCHRPLTSPAAKPFGLTRVWVKTGQPRQPLACVWLSCVGPACIGLACVEVDKPASSLTESDSPGAEPAGLCRYA